MFKISIFLVWRISFFPKYSNEESDFAPRVIQFDAC